MLILIQESWCGYERVYLSSRTIGTSFNRVVKGYTMIKEPEVVGGFNIHEAWKNLDERDLEDDIEVIGPGQIACPVCAQMYWRWGEYQICCVVYPTNWYDLYEAGENDRLTYKLPQSSHKIYLTGFETNKSGDNEIWKERIAHVKNVVNDCFYVYIHGVIELCGFPLNILNENVKPGDRLITTMTGDMEFENWRIFK